MHFESWAKPGHHHDTQKALKGRLVGYCHEHNPVINVAALQEMYGDAVTNAIRAATRREEEGSSSYGDPSTNVHLLTERIRSNGKQ
ncbi:hypothetical protein D3C86_1917470 [compost metagenome]